MQIEYKRDMNHNYLILYGENEVNTASYQVRMLVGNVIPSLLKCRIQGVDGKFMVYYDITSRQSVFSMYEQKKLGIEELRLIFGGFVQVMEEMSEYLLNPGELVIRPECIYGDVQKKQLLFCYLPGNQRDVREQFRELTEYILPKIDHEDQRAVMLGYGVYRRALEDSFHLENIKEELYRVQPQESMPGEIPAKEKSVCGETQNPGRAESFPEMSLDFGDISFSRDGVSAEEKKERVRKKPEDRADGKKLQKKGVTGGAVWKKAAGCAAGTAVLTGIAALKILGFLPWLRMEVMLGAALAAMSIGVLLYRMISRRSQRSSPEVRADRSIFGEEAFARDMPFVCEDASQPIREASGESQSSLYRDTGTLRDKGKIQEDCGETVVLSAAAAAGPSSLVSREPGELATIYLQEDMTIIGKLETASDAVISLPTISRVHAKIKKRDGEYYLSDLNSRNGTSVNGRLLKTDEEYHLQDQDEVDFAQARYVFLK